MSKSEGAENDAGNVADAAAAGTGGQIGGAGGVPVGAGGQGGSVAQGGGPNPTGGVAGVDAGAASSKHVCEDGAPCSAGATCEISMDTAGMQCQCDPSGHFFCDAWTNGGAPPFDPCSSEAACSSGGTCSHSNGWCEKTCQCQTDCSMTCPYNGPSVPGWGGTCDGGLCFDSEYLTFVSCKLHDGDCNIEVSCTSLPGTVTGYCP